MSSVSEEQNSVPDLPPFHEIADAFANMPCMPANGQSEEEFEDFLDAVLSRNITHNLREVLLAMQQEKEDEEDEEDIKQLEGGVAAHTIC
jgi:hypothetical protein